MDGIDRTLLVILSVCLFALSIIHSNEMNELKEHIAALEGGE